MNNVETNTVASVDETKSALDNSAFDSGPFRYRMYDFDDWGMIRTSDGEFYAAVRRRSTLEEDNEARRLGKDPYAALGHVLVAALNGMLSVPHDKREYLIDMCAQVAGDEETIHSAIVLDENSAEWERVEAGYRASTARLIRERMESIKKTLCEPPHEDDLAVDRFAQAMKAKLARKRAQGFSGWNDPSDCSMELLSKLLVEHVGKGDPVDVANFSMMLHQRGERILAAE